MPKTSTVDGQTVLVYLPLYYASLRHLWLFFKADVDELKKLRARRSRVRFLAPTLDT